MFKTKAFSDLKPFDTISWDNLYNRYVLNQIELFKDTRWKIDGNFPIDTFPYVENEDKSRTYKPIGYFRECDYGTLVNAKSDITGKTITKECIENGRFIFVTLPKNIILKNNNALLHNQNLNILKNFIDEVENSQDKWNNENWKKIQSSYDLKYPNQTTNTNKKEPVYAWRADFSIEWYMSLKEEGIINPILYFIDKKPDTRIKTARWEFDGRATHRLFLIAKAGYDIPLLLRHDNDTELEYFSVKDRYPKKLELNIKDKKIKLYKLNNEYDEICY